ncbi:hypothetical protein SAMN06269185_1638 [Natronoarchaeum philippinense]|uniref:Uncharacterized protein n=1 Tax=Natronoarchaeum philippinense TaxID=558529 RepID=A0A285NWS8_NATPI|nr:hypothetical protein [Natronoarchaeum philippinense]SNZ12346.1 hypothetical protein SAMN06269185_1638 [Natronoarchaeum philippinense]
MPEDDSNDNDGEEMDVVDPEEVDHALDRLGQKRLAIDLLAAQRDIAESLVGVPVCEDQEEMVFGVLHDLEEAAEAVWPDDDMPDVGEIAEGDWDDDEGENVEDEAENEEEEDGEE